MVYWVGLLVPVAYLSVLVGSLATFSSLYRKSKTAKSASLAPWFGPHLQRNIYLTLLHQEDGTKVPDSVLKAALMRRAMEDVKRIMQIHQAKPALQRLLQGGSVGDDLWQRLLRAEQEMNEEARDVISEANAFAPGWGDYIFQSASEMAGNTQFRKRLEEMQASVVQEREWWEKKRADTQAAFMKELDEQSAGASRKSSIAKGSDDDTVLVEGGGPSANTPQGKGKGKKGKK